MSEKPLKGELIIPDRQAEGINRVFMYFHYRKKVIPIRILTETEESDGIHVHIEIDKNQLKKICKEKVLNDRSRRAKVL